MSTLPTINRPRGPRLEAIIVLVIASCALLATSSGLPSISTIYEAETSFDGPGDQTVPIVVRLNEAAWRAAQTESAQAEEPAADLEVYGPELDTVRIAGSNALALDACGPSGDCDVPAQVTVQWLGQGPATVIWSVRPWIYFHGPTVPDGATVGVMGPTPNRLPALVLLGVGIGILASILAWVVRRRWPTGQRAREAMDTGALGAAVVVLALAGVSLLAGWVAYVAAPVAIGLGLLLLGLAVLVVVGLVRRSRDGNLLVLAALGAAALTAVPLALGALIVLPVYRPMVIVIVAAILVAFVGLALATALARERSSAAGRLLTRPQRLVVLIQAAAAALFAAAGTIAIGSLGPGSDDIPSYFADAGVVAIALAGLLVVGLYRWLRGRTRLLTTSWIVVCLGVLLLLAGEVLLSLALLAEWQSPLSAAVGALLSPRGIGTVVLLGVGVLMVRARRYAPVSPEARS